MLSTGVTQNTFLSLYKSEVDSPYNSRVPSKKATIRWDTTGVLKPGQMVTAEQILTRPDVKWDANQWSGQLYSILLIDVSIQNKMAAIQWMVTNIPGTNIKKGDEVMEYVPPIAWRNCWQGKDNHGSSCRGTGLIVEPTYNHRNVLWVFRQKKKVQVPKNERQSGCDLNLGSSIIPPDQGVWHFSNITFWIAKYGMVLESGTFFKQPYTRGVGSILCHYSYCQGATVLSGFLAGAPNLPGLTDGKQCAGPNRNQKSPINWPAIVLNKDQDSVPAGAGYGSYYEGCTQGRGLNCGTGLKPCWDRCTCLRINQPC